MKLMSGREFKPFAERNPRTIGLIGLLVMVALVVGALNYKKLPFFDGGKEYTAYFAEAGGLKSGSLVQVSGFRVGEVSSVELDGARVLVTFTVDKSIRLGDRTEASIKTKSLLGAKILDIAPRGAEALSGTIPVDRTTSPYQLPDALGDLSATISGLDTGKVSDALSTLSDTFANTPPDLKLAVDGITRFSESLGKRDDQLRKLLSDANKATTVLAERSTKVVGLVQDTNALLSQLQTQSAALDQISGNLSALATQLSHFIADNRPGLKPALDKLNGVLTLVDNRRDSLGPALKSLNEYALSLGEAVASGPFFKAYVSNLLPGQFIQPFVDAAFSDLGLDPNVLLPSQLHDPETGQPGTPALPVPFPRTGQGGDPHLSLPDAITGNPGDPRYPYREPLPAPAPGGPPPGPPADVQPPPGPQPVLVHAPGEQPTADPVPGPPSALEGGQ